MENRFPCRPFSSENTGAAAWGYPFERLRYSQAVSKSAEFLVVQVYVHAKQCGPKKLSFAAADNITVVNADKVISYQKRDILFFILE